MANELAKGQGQGHAGKGKGKGKDGPEGEVASCVTNLIRAFVDGLDVFKRLRERRRKRRSKKEGCGEQVVAGPPPPLPSGAELQLSNSLRKGPEDIARCYGDCYSKAGDRFAKGDAVAHVSLAETLIRLNTGLVAIIATFLNHDSKSTPMKLDYKSLTNLSDASRAEAVDSLHQLYQRLSQSNINLYQVQLACCPRCGSTQHYDCYPTSTSHSKSLVTTSSKHSKSHTSSKSNSRARSSGPIITRRPIKSSNQTELVIIRPRSGSRRNSSSSSATSSSKSSSTASSRSNYTAPSKFLSPTSSSIVSARAPVLPPLPQYSVVDPFAPPPREMLYMNPLPPPPPPPQAMPAALPVVLEKTRSFPEPEGPHPSTWPQHPSTHSAALQFQPPYQVPKPAPAPMPTPTSPSTEAPPSPPRKPPKSSPKSPPLPPLPTSTSPKFTPCPGNPAIKRRLDKATPSTYTFATDSTKLGEIPANRWAAPFDYAEAERLNAEALMHGYPMPPGLGQGQQGQQGRQQKRGLFGGLFRRTGGGGVGGTNVVVG